ncbi:hypothetical protein [Streptomyces sp. NBC_01314]|uniref:hypothetical protein n=1 Tax=Streptomyces sp. NBC_01314 TaxID=2903821 RepID=UPI003093BB36|nr:hypothetical protein OG622_13130 [Streptomyces sp. NBC_01314]
MRLPSARPVTAPSACQDLTLPAPAGDASPVTEDTFLGFGRTAALAMLAVAVVVIVGAGVLTVRTLRGTRTAKEERATV